MAGRPPSSVHTIKHVALRAGVSFTTVSHVLNGTRPVSDAARLRVQQAVDELGYAPSAIARALKRNETHVLGVLVPNITNPFFAELTRGIEDWCRHTRYSVFLCNCDDDPAQQERYLQTLGEWRVDGLVLAAPAGEPAALAERLDRMPLAKVLVDRAVPARDAHLVRVDHQAGAEVAVRHLLALGHRRIACLSGPLAFEVSRQRVAGWRQALHEAGVPIEHGWLCEGDFSAASGYEMMRTVLDAARPTAVFATNDLLGIGALRAAAEAGLSVPRDVSVVGFDGIDLGAYVHPALTTVWHPIRAMGELAAQALVDAIGGVRAPRETVLAPALMQRASTGPVPA